MCFAISLVRHEIQDASIEEFDLESRLTSRGENAVPEFQFKFGDPVPQLPVLQHGQFNIFEWGNRNNKKSRLPRTGWCRQESLDEGRWKWLSPELVEIPASYGQVAVFR